MIYTTTLKKDAGRWLVKTIDPKRVIAKKRENLVRQHKEFRDTILNATKVMEVLRIPYEAAREALKEGVEIAAYVHGETDNEVEGDDLPENNWTLREM